jgi:ATP-dependent 26S proteasome regulatory subunit
MNQADAQILTLIRAGYPIIVVESHEEQRVCEAVLEIASALDRLPSNQDGEMTEIYFWSVSQGMEKAVPAPTGDEPRLVAGVQPGIPVAPLKHIEGFVQAGSDDPRGKRALFVLKDFHAWVDNPQVLRTLRDVAGKLVSRHQTIILLSPTFKVPQDAEKEIAVVPYPLPTSDELAVQLDCFIDSLPESVPVHVNGDRATIARALQGLTRFEADAVLAQAVIATGEMALSAVDFVLNEKAQIIRKSGTLQFWPEQASYSDVGGLDLLKSWTRQAMAAFSPEAAAYGIEPPRGFLAVGVPGSGKSLLAKAVAGGTMPLVRLDVGALMGGIVGQSEANTRAALKTIEAVSPCVVWMDEVEKALGSGGGELDGGTSTRVLGTLLTWLQETKAPVFVVATANDISSLRPELIRRFEEIFFVDVPQHDERAEIFAIHLRKRSRDPEAFDLEGLAKQTDGYTGAEIERVVKDALRAAFADGGREMGTSDLEMAVKATVPLSTTMTEQIDAMRAWASRARPASSKQDTGHKVEQANGRAMMFS